MSYYSDILPSFTMEDIAVSLITLVAGVLGLLSNSVAILAVFNNMASRNSFGLLCFFRTITNIGMLAFLLFWITQMTVLSNKIETDWMDKVFGLMNVMLWNVNVYLRFAISLNRLIAITLPLQTSTILNVKNTSIVVLLCWLFGFCHITPYLRTEKCFILFNTTTWSWTFSDSSCIRNGWNSANFYTILAVLIAILLLDFTTIISLKSKNNGMKCQDREQFYSYVAQRRRLRMEIRLFVQTIYENSIFFYAIVNFYYFSTLFKNRWIVFFTSTFVWQICLALDGLIISLFHFRPSHLGIKSIRTKTPMIIPAITKSFNFKAKKHEKNACVWTWK